MNYVSQANATAMKLAYVNDAGNAIIKVDNITNVPYPEKRDSVSIPSYPCVILRASSREQLFRPSRIEGSFTTRRISPTSNPKSWSAILYLGSSQGPRHLAWFLGMWSCASPILRQFLNIPFPIMIPVSGIIFPRG